jgi:biotin carboxyl carrier protein
MKLQVQLTGPDGTALRNVEIKRAGESLTVSLDGQVVEADCVEINSNTFSILLAGQCYEVRIVPSADGTLKLHAGQQEFTAEVSDPRAWRGRRHGAIAVEGSQQIVAPMPGKVIRVLAKSGDAVEAGQGLLVIEAMKMQNEIRSPKSGIVERMHVKEGQAVNAGEVLCTVS